MLGPLITRSLGPCSTLGVIAAASLGLVGCVQRTLHLTSEPPGALVWLNDQEVGRTPLDVPFTYYGTYDVRLEREGYQPLWTKRKAKAPLWDALGPDLFAEAIPGAKSDIRWKFTMKPKGAVDEKKLIDHARQLQAMIRSENPTE